jgi:hypothetical protein
MLEPCDGRTLVNIAYLSGLDTNSFIRYFINECRLLLKRCYYFGWAKFPLHLEPSAVQSSGCGPPCTSCTEQRAASVAWDVRLFVTKS